MGEPFQISGAGKQSPARPDNPRFTLLVGTPRFDPYRINTGFPFSRDKNRLKIWENLFKSRAQASSRLLVPTILASLCLSGRRDLILTGSIQVSHFLAIRIA